MVICICCRGSGVLTVPGSKHVVKPEKDPWDDYDGRNYHIKVCPKCHGTGEMESPTYKCPNAKIKVKIGYVLDSVNYE